MAAFIQAVLAGMAATVPQCIVHTAIAAVHLLILVLTHIVLMAAIQRASIATVIVHTTVTRAAIALILKVIVQVVVKAGKVVTIRTTIATLQQTTTIITRVINTAAAIPTANMQQHQNLLLKKLNLLHLLNLRHQNQKQSQILSCRHRLLFCPQLASK